MSCITEIQIISKTMDASTRLYAQSQPEKTILIVDDLADNLRILTNALSGQGFQIRCAKSGTFALMAIQTFNPDLILLDIKMPDMDGYEVCQRLKAMAKTRDIPVIFLSALEDALDKVKAFSVGAVDYITKPFQVEEVLIRVRHQLELQAARAEIQRANAELERRVEQRTAQLAATNERLALTNQKLAIEIQERQRAEARASASEERLNDILNSLEDVVWSYDPKLNKILYVNLAVERMYGYSMAQFLDNPNLRLERTHPADRARVEAAHHNLLITGSLREEYRILRSDGEAYWVSDRAHAVYAADGHILRIDGITRDITEQMLALEQLVHDTLHDALTGLPNRTLFMDRVGQALKHTKRNSNYLFAVFFIDLDRFKMVNDSLGHSMGDRLLQTVAKLLEACLRSQDTVARLGGDEFTILLDDISEISQATIVAERILNQLTTPLEVNGQLLFTSASIGIVIGNRDYQTAEELLRDADIAMYRSKSLGRGRWTVFDKQMYEQNLTIIQLDNDLRYALERQELELYYQPIIALETRKLAGFEALIRWHHPERGLVSPAEFIPLAEDTGLILTIGNWVLYTACQQLHIWQQKCSEATALKMSLNISSRQIQDVNFLASLDSVLVETGIDGYSLNLEITESTLMDQRAETLATLKELKVRHIQLSIDDFGQGYSSLSYLHRFPFNTLKIDRFFIDQMTIDEEKFAIVRTITALAHTLDMNVVAEGVENEKQVMILRQLGCEFAQGYYFAKPLTASDAEKMILQ